MNTIEISDHSDDVRQLLKQAIAKGLTSCGMTAQAYAALAVPVDTGNLRNSIQNKRPLKEAVIIHSYRKINRIVQKDLSKREAFFYAQKSHQNSTKIMLSYAHFCTHRKNRIFIMLNY